ncbi:hypothetical protein PoB_003656600 [Plakobranchus ocellatus]|uniref:Uncharacterized protein n=1 Tax=Plakobranchus ocellatus TaxID=259542 RepID=A0AAV4AFV8_9GAST|nr:hypothetical protein PoB_003656600 [Plakobranchus ocellatus]
MQASFETATEPNQGDTLRGSPALCQGYPGAIFPAEGVGPLLGLTQALFEEEYPADWAARVSAALPSQEMDVAEESPLTTRTVRWVNSIPDSTWEEKEVGDSRRRSRRDESAGKEVGIEDKSQVEKKRCHLVLTRGSS